MRCPLAAVIADAAPPIPPKEAARRGLEIGWIMFPLWHPGLSEEQRRAAREMAEIVAK